jgi:ectoine hydroxylase-related dioxygenase (phytanoyl-CoA dioxygenase family)
MMRNGLTVFTYCLSHAGPGDGGFGCIPGSHKSNFTVDIPDEVRTYQRAAHYVRQVEVEAGDLIIFTEALIHGTIEWTADHERRSLLFKYSPGHSSWSSTYYDAADYPEATEQQQRMLAPPSIGGRADTVEA